MKTMPPRNSHSERFALARRELLVAVHGEPADRRDDAGLL